MVLVQTSYVILYLSNYKIVTTETKTFHNLALIPVLFCMHTPYINQMRQLIFHAKYSTVSLLGSRGFLLFLSTNCTNLPSLFSWNTTYSFFKTDLKCANSITSNKIFLSFFNQHSTFIHFIGIVQVPSA